MVIKQWLTVAVCAGVACGSAMAQERARVLSSVPVLQQVAVPQQYCQNEQVYTGQRTNGTGAVIGALIGGVAGNALGRGTTYHAPRGYGPRGHGGYRHPGYVSGSNRGASTVVGAIAGGLIGNAIESSQGQPQYETVRRCTQETVYENRAVAYDVTYEYAGKRYYTRMDQDPGAWMPVSVAPQPQAYGSATYSNPAYNAPVYGGSAYDGATYGSPTYSAPPAATSTSRFVGPSGVYQAAPAGTSVTGFVTDSGTPLRTTHY